MILMRCPDFVPYDGRYLGPQSPLVLYSIPDGKVRVQGGLVVLVVRLFLDMEATHGIGSFAFLSLSLLSSPLLSSPLLSSPLSLSHSLFFLSSSFLQYTFRLVRCLRCPPNLRIAKVYAAYQTCASRSRWMRFDKGR